MNYPHLENELKAINRFYWRKKFANYLYLLICLIVCAICFGIAKKLGINNPISWIAGAIFIVLGIGSQGYLDENYKLRTQKRTDTEEIQSKMRYIRLKEFFC